MQATYGGQNKGVVGEDECAESISHLRELKLSELPNLMYLTEESSQLLPHEYSTSFQHLEILEVLGCGSLKKLVSSSISFRNLRNLTVSRCHGMLNFLTSTTAKTMTVLETMTISECKRMTEIIADVDHDNDADVEPDEIVFLRLEILELNCLQSLTNFY